jgi:hypothetical protein
MSKLAVFAAVAAALVAPSVAAAKEVRKVQVCGASACFTFDRGNSGGKLALFAQVGDSASSPGRPAAWYRLRITIGAHGMRPFAYTNEYVPGLDRIRIQAEGGGHEWVGVIDDLRPVLRNVAAGLDPLPAAGLPGVAAPPEAGADGSRWPPIAAAAAGAALLLLVVATLRRHRWRGPTGYEPSRQR